MAEAGYHGVPLIVTTHGMPELEWQADRMASLGLGIWLGKDDTNVENIRKSAIQISEDDSILRAVKQMRYLVRREPGAEETANRIEEYIESRSN